MLRILLKQVFGLGSYCKYNPGAKKSHKKWDSIGFRALCWPKPTWEETYQTLLALDALCLIRTHDVETDDNKTIYVVRDGRSVVRSYYHFLRDRNGMEQATLKEVIAGKIGYGSWSKHLTAWDPFSRPDTLVVRYEDLLHAPDPEIQRLEAFLGVPAVAPWENRFEEWQKLSPSFFRKGSSRPPVEEYSEKEMKRFWKYHGEWMKRLGYGDSVTTPAK